MLLQDAILSQHFVAEARRQLGIHGKFNVIKTFEEFPLMQTEISDMATETLERFQTTHQTS